MTDTSRPSASPDLSPILSWYSGKARDAIRVQILPILSAAIADGCWAPKQSRRVRAALSRQAIARKFAIANERHDVRGLECGSEGLLQDVANVRGEAHYRSTIRGRSIIHVMLFGQFQMAESVLALVDQLGPHAICDAERAALETARRWASDFTPVARAVAALDAVRPRPSYVFGEISRTVLANVGRDMGLAFESVRSPVVQWKLVDRKQKDGTVCRVWEGEILWPEGTRHGCSRYARSGGGQCEACGHAIRRADNWIPLVLDGEGGPASLWVGKDCARHLFGCRATGEGEIRR